ncbi:MAG: hypothetical protein Kow006_26840 [Gammaproteobacteria bacterium]
MAAVLPEDRADLLYHAYDGGGVEVTGPSLLVRKGLGQSVSAYANYYVDSVSSASVDVVTTASAYGEERTETSIGVDYLRDRTIMSLSRTTSEETDYEASSLHFNISQDVFGDLTTISMGYSRGEDNVYRNIGVGGARVRDPTFGEEVDRQQYRIGVSQILTKDLIVSLNFESITDEGYLNNPYRSVRYLDAGSPTGFSYEPERYPNTRSSDALALRGRYFLPYRAAIYGEYRKYKDTWGIKADTYEFGYVHPLGERWILEASYRHYDQNAADFYSDLFPYSNAQNYLARDKELSTFSSQTIGVKASYQIANKGWAAIDQFSVSLALDHIEFEYDDFRDLTQLTGTAGTEPLYGFTANVLQFYVSIWY